MSEKEAADHLLSKQTWQEKISLQWITAKLKSTTQRSARKKSSTSHVITRSVSWEHMLIEEKTMTYSKFWKKNKQEYIASPNTLKLFFRKEGETDFKTSKTRELMALQKIPKVDYKSRSRRNIITVIKTNKSTKYRSKAFSIWETEALSIQ